MSNFNRNYGYNVRRVSGYNNNHNFNYNYNRYGAMPNPNIVFPMRSLAHLHPYNYNRYGYVPGPGLVPVGGINQFRRAPGWYAYANRGWPPMPNWPMRLGNVLRNPNKYAIWPANTYLLQNARHPIMNTYARFNQGVGFGGPQLMHYLPPHLPIWQYYQRKDPGFKYLALTNPPPLEQQLGFPGRQNPHNQLNRGQFPFGATENPLDRTIADLPRTTLQRVGDGINSLLGRRPTPSLSQLQQPLTGTVSFPFAPAGSAQNFNAQPSMNIGQNTLRPSENRERQEAVQMLLTLRGEIQKFTQQNAPLLPATQRVVGTALASIAQNLQNPALTRNHAMATARFWQSIATMDQQTRGQLAGQTEQGVVGEENI